MTNPTDQQTPVQKKLELKAYLPDINKAREICFTFHAKKVKTTNQKETHYMVNKGRLKHTNNDEVEHSIIHYDRLNTPGLRTNTYARSDLASSHQEEIEKLKSTHGIYAVINKKREIYETNNAIINLDSIEGLGDFIEIEIPHQSGNQESDIQDIATNLLNIFNITPDQLFPYAYSDLMVMKEAASKWRHKLQNGKNIGTVFLVDGFSCVGKTSITQAVLRDPELNVKLIQRYTTRKRRENVASESEYIFVTYEQFQEKIMSGELLEFRDFEFGMSYALGWEEVINCAISGTNALGLINPGNSAIIKKMFPEAISILINAPLETIKNRLISRGKNTEEQIYERLENAKKVDHYKHTYDYIIDNHEGSLDESIAKMKEIILSYHK